MSPSQPDRQATANRRLRVVAPGLGVLQCRARPDRLRQPSAALDEWPDGQILAVELQKVEDAVDDRVLGQLLGRRPGDPEALLKSGEGRLVTVVRHHLAVEQEIPGLLSRHSAADLGVGAGEILAGARLESHDVAHFACDAALTVELALEQPIVAEVATVGQGGQHQRDCHTNIVSRGRRGTHAAREAMFHGAEDDGGNPFIRKTPHALLFVRTADEAVRQDSRRTSRIRACG